MKVFVFKKDIGEGVYTLTREYPTKEAFEGAYKNGDVKIEEGDRVLLVHGEISVKVVQPEPVVRFEYEPMRKRKVKQTA